MEKATKSIELERMQNAFNATMESIDVSDSSMIFGMKILEEVFLKNKQRNCNPEELKG